MANEININRNATNSIKWTVTRDYTAGVFVATMRIRHRLTNALLLEKTIEITNATTLTANLTDTDTAFSDLTDADEFGWHPYEIECENNTGDVYKEPDNSPALANIIDDLST